jgi:phytoene dehydrogenase-like protein
MWLLVNHFGEENPSAAPGGASSVVLQTYSSWDWQDCWRSRGKGLPRNEDYRSLKAEAAKELVRTAENVAPGLGSRVLFLDAGTPLSSERFTLNSRGSSGGWCYGDRESFVFRRPKKNLITTPLENLFTAGHYSLWPGGVISAALSGKIAANFSCGRRAMERFSS